MCDQCDERVKHAEAEFHCAVEQYRQDIADGGTEGQTEGERICDLAAIMYAFMSRSGNNRACAAWMLAYAMDRSVEAPGSKAVDTRLITIAVNEKRYEAGKPAFDNSDIVEMFEVAFSLSKGSVE